MVIRNMASGDAQQIIDMMRVFYRSPAVHTNGSVEIFQSDVENCINENPYLEGYVFEEGHCLLGYAMAAKSFSTEFGKPCIWVEDLYIQPEYRGRGIGKAFLQFIAEKYPDAVLRLEVEEENTHAVHLYTQCGYQRLPYCEMIRR